MNQKQKDVLCKMVATKVKELSEAISAKFTLSGMGDYALRTHVRHEYKDGDYQLTASQQRKITKLRKMQAEIDKKQDEVGEQVNSLVAELKEVGAKQREADNSARHKLKVASENAVIEIQFAEDAQCAKSILEGLPTVEQLTK